MTSPAISKRMPRTINRKPSALMCADFPLPGTPVIMMLGLVVRPSFTQPEGWALKACMVMVSQPM